MKYLFLSVLCICLFSCAHKMIPLKGVYPIPPMTETTTDSYDTVWSRLIDYIALTGGYTRVIDKSSGILVSEDYVFTNETTTEDKKGKAIDSRAFLVASKYKTANTTLKPGPQRVTGNWNVRLRPTQSGTFISVNITNLKAFDYYSFKGMSGYSEAPYQVKSTGFFEYQIIGAIR